MFNENPSSRHTQVTSLAVKGVRYAVFKVSQLLKVPETVLDEKTPVLTLDSRAPGMIYTQVVANCHVNFVHISNVTPALEMNIILEED